MTKSSPLTPTLSPGCARGEGVESAHSGTLSHPGPMVRRVPDTSSSPMVRRASDTPSGPMARRASDTPSNPMMRRASDAPSPLAQPGERVGVRGLFSPGAA